MVNLKIPFLRVLFYGTVSLYVIVVLVPYAFVTHDGPSHLYNAHIINEILFSSNTIYEKYHTFNPNWSQPNLIGYFVMCPLQLIMPFLWAEKILVALYVLIFSFGFRLFLKQVSSNADWYSLMIFPFIFNTVLFWGFCNFLIGLALMFWLIGLYEKHKLKLGPLQILYLTLLSILIFYSHALVFVLSVLYVFIRIVIDNHKKWSKHLLIFSLKSILFFLPGTILFLIYLYQQKSSSIVYDEGYNLFKRLSQLWFQIDSLFFSGYSESFYLKLFYIILLILTILFFYYHWREKKNIFIPAFILFLVYFLIYLLIPDYAAGGGIILIRVNLMFFLFWIAWLSCQPLSKYIKSLIIVFYLISLPFLSLRWSVIACGALQCKHVIELSENMIPSNSVFSTIHYKNVQGFIGDYQMHSYIDLMSNLDNYIAIKHNAVTLHNYEANSAFMASYFPIIWKEWKNSEFVWAPIIRNGKLEYFKLDQFEKNWNHKPEIIISIGSLEADEKTKSIWDSENNYSLIKTDSIHFLNIYSLNLLIK